MARRWLLALALASGLVAGGIYHLATARAEIVVAARDMTVPRPLGAEDVELRSVTLDLVPAAAARRVEDVLGLIPRAPLFRGQLVLSNALATELADLPAGVTLASGYRAIAIPVSAVGAVGGVIVPGARVDVLAVPVIGRAPAGRMVELLATSATVLDVRGESGATLAPRDPKTSTALVDRVASVIVAIPVADELRFADRIATSTFVLALAATR
ncbi:MAG TPA: Flp pilus assembly protein CpaB [Candidatus Limnocylindria bacterium]|nr:Flp pilus assembly protein CpaB [Candidatus Limnocylindria bacterium]